MFGKDISNVSYDDIKSLLDSKIPESDILDYKSKMMDDQKLVKHVCAFANTRGGDIVFGIKESGHGGHPIEINGLDAFNFNKERLEQIILSNIVPRLDVKIKSIPIPDSQKVVLVIQVPPSYLKPHQSNYSKKILQALSIRVR